MTSNAQIIAIAEACGYINVSPGQLWEGVVTRHPNYSTIYGDWPATQAKDVEVPRYLTSLDAMHEAEKVLFPKLAHKYKLALAELKGFGGNNHDKIWHATAAQRAEAFLKTIGKWKD